jgi:serine/threonine protein kinase
MEYLHERDFCHRDLKPANVLCDEHLHAKLCDFGAGLGTNRGPKLTTVPKP